MGITLPLLIGFLTTSIGIAPPGLLNMTAAKISVNEGRTQAVIFAFGATLTVLIQIYIAVIFARFIDRNPDIIIMLREIGLATFIAITAYFFWRSAKPKPAKKDITLHSKKSRFFLGMLLSALNFFPIPFYVFVSITLASYDYFSFEKFFIYLFVVGSGVGAFFGFYCYIVFFLKFETKTAFLIKNMNYIIASITGIISVLTLWNIILYYYDA